MPEVTSDILSGSSMRDAYTAYATNMKALAEENAELRSELASAKLMMRRESRYIYDELRAIRRLLERQK